MSQFLEVKNANGKFIRIENPDSNMSDVTIDGSNIAKNSDLVSGLAGKANTIVANDSQVKTALNANGTAPIYACRAWVNFNGTGTVAIRASGNVSSITDNGVGNYVINLTTAMNSISYTNIANCYFESNTNGISCFNGIINSSSFSVRLLQYGSNKLDSQEINAISL